MGLTAMAQNYKNSVDWIIGAYSDAGVSFPNGFQKDSIQNAVGARKNNKWKNWACNISYIENLKGKFVVVEDFGTLGLIGKNRSVDELRQMMADDEKLGPDERLSRFTTMFNSGGNITGGGLFGAGKSVYSVASKKYTYYFDSKREDGIYVANVNKSGQVEELAFEGELAEKYILENTGLSPKNTAGTRVIIVDPKDELVQSINDGSIIDYIQESWWLIIQRLTDGAAIKVNGKPVQIPEGIKNGTHIFDLANPDTYAINYKVKHFGFYLFENGGNTWEGISYYRKGMKIGEIELKDIPEKLKGKFWGYIEVDEKWEDGLADIEDKVHFGVSKGKKSRQAYQNLKNYTNEKVKKLLCEWGFIKDKENEDKKLKDELKQIAEEVQDLFDSLGFEDLGKGPQKADFDVRWQDIQYPVEGSERVSSGDEIKYSFRIKSSYATDKKFEYKLYVLNQGTGEIVSHIDNDKVTIRSNTVFKKEYIHKITKENSARYAENRIILSVKVIGSGKEKQKELVYFFDIDRPDNSRDIVNLSLHECRFPIEGSRRVNFDECIEKVCYKIENKRNHTLSYKLNISIHNASDPSSPKIVDIASYTNSVEPFGECITPYIDKIVFDKSIYERYITEGILELRARLIANEDDEQFEKGDKITSYYYKIFLNMDEKNGKNDAFDVQSIDAPDQYKRSWFTPGNGRTIYLNVGHVAYLNAKDYPEIQHEYLREQMLKQYVLLYLAEGKYDMFVEKGQDFADLEPQEAADRVIEKIEHIYYKSLE